MFAPAATGARWTDIPPHSREVILILTACGLAFLILWPTTPFSATVNAPEAELVVLRGRLVFAFAVGLCLFCAAGALLPDKTTCRDAWWAWGLVTLFASQPPRASIVLLCGAAAIPIVFMFRKYQKASPGETAWIPVLALPIALVFAAGLYADRSRSLAETNLFRLGQEYGLTSAWQVMNELDSARVTSYGVRSLWYYPLFGRSLQNSPVYADRTGIERTPVHEAWKRGRYHWWQGHEEALYSDPEPSGKELLWNLRNSGVEYVLFGFREDFTPQQYHLLKDLPEVETVYAGSSSAVFRLTPEKAPDDATVQKDQ